MILCNKFSPYQTQSVSRQPLQESFELILAHEKAETLLFIVSKQRWMWSFYKGSPDTINFHNVWHGNQSYLDKVKVRTFALYYFTHACNQHRSIIPPFIALNENHIEESTVVAGNFVNWPSPPGVLVA